MNISENFRKLEKYTRYSILLIALFSLIVLYLTFTYHVSGDGCWHIQVAKFIADNARLPLFEPLGRDEPFWSPPLYHIVVAAIYYAFGIFNHNAADFAVKFASPAFGILSLIFSFLVIKKLTNPKIAFYSIIFLAFIPLNLDYSVFSYIDGMLRFLVILSVYLALENRIVGSAVTLGLVVLTKYNGIFILPVLLFIVYSNGKNKKEILKRSAIILVITAIIGSIWFIRNWVYLQNPIWPFMNSIFHGYDAQSFSANSVGTVDLSKIISIKALTSVYLGVFGVPNGSVNALYFFKIPYWNFLLTLWFLGTLIFICPLFVGLASKKLKCGRLLAIWISAYFILVLLYVVNVGWSVIRFMLPAFPAIAVIWAFGAEKIKSWRIGNFYMLLIFFVIIGMVFTSFLKIGLAAKEWGSYSRDFGWVKANTPKDAVFIAHGQCVPYNIERASLYLNNENLQKADYVWVNQNFRLDRLSIFNDKQLNMLQSLSYPVVYSNKETGTIVHKTK